MTQPNATYRLQLRDGMTFARAAGIADYLAQLGASHLYASPLFAAAHGSSHGYDGIDFSVMEPAIGGEAGFDQLCAALAEAGLELLVDFVPNHMAAADSNAWWQQVLEWGVASPCAAYFDIDWSAPKLLLPILGSGYGEILRQGNFGIDFEPCRGQLFFTCYERRLPLTPPSYALLLDRVKVQPVTELASLFAGTTIDEADALKSRLAQLAADPVNAAAVGAGIAAAAGDPALLHQLHEAQIWRLAHWRLGREALTYRRFFEIADLICLKVENQATFAAVHARLFQLIAAGAISGVRLDHIDGLADPKSYLENFQHAVGGSVPHYLLVEKIVEPGENLRGDWPVAGTTGYEFIVALAGLFTDPDGEAPMTRAYDAFTGEQTNYTAAALAAKREIFECNLAAELAILTRLAQAAAARDLRTRDLGADTLRRAIVELAAALPVYRTYVNVAGPDEADRALISKASGMARMSRCVAEPSAVDFIERLLLVDFDSPKDRDAALGFAIRFQQTSGPVMAKAIEDTMFYRYNRLIALNEVGGTPEIFGAPLSEFHAVMSERLRTQPGGLSATATHDTKRGEDARARLYVLSEMPQLWQQAVSRWSQMNAPHRANLAAGAAPEPGVEWLFYQALAGVWPVDLSPDDEQSLAALRDRMLAYMEKAAREAKTHTSWTDINGDYEQALRAFVAATLSAATGGGFLDDFVNTCQPVWVAGAINSLAQLAIKLTAPGVPDFYQGAELWDLSLVDPDNRVPVDFSSRQRLLQMVSDTGPESLLDDWVSGAPKLALTAAGLKTRSQHPLLFAEGEYVALDVIGDRARHVVAFARFLSGAYAVTVAPRFVLDLIGGADRPWVPAAHWGDTAIVLPDAMHGQPMRDVLTGASHDPSTPLPVATVLAHFPVGLMVEAG